MTTQDTGIPLEPVNPEVLTGYDTLPVLTPPPSHGRRNIFITVGVLTAIVIGGITAAVAIGGGSSGQAIRAGFVVLGGTGCDLTDTGYADLTVGTPVMMKDATGNLVSTSALANPHANAVDNSCTFKFTFDNVKLASQQYTVEVGKRGQVGFSKSEIISNNYSVVLSVGTEDGSGSTETPTPEPVATTDPTDAYNQGIQDGNSVAGTGDMTIWCQSNSKRYVLDGDAAAADAYMQGCLNGSGN
jgi:hypothetical protein